MSDTWVHTAAVMGTVVTIQVVGHGAGQHQRMERQAAVERAVAWFQAINDICTRFDAASELSRLSTRIDVPVPVSALLFEAVQFALAVAEETQGAFDPTIGLQLESRGFNEEYRTGQQMHTRLDRNDTVSWRDVHLDPVTNAITLRRPLLLDLGAVAKGLAIDTAARELQPFENFAIDAGGDLYLGGCNDDHAPWSIGIRHPRDGDKLVDTLRVSDMAVCTSGDYERHNRAGHHIIDPRTDAPAAALASVTIVAPSAMLADALGTAVFVLGPAEGLELLERHGVDGLLITPALERFVTPGMARHFQLAPA